MQRLRRLERNCIRENAVCICGRKVKNRFRLPRRFGLKVRRARKLKADRPRTQVHGNELCCRV
jgi:hypothetical protein